MKTSRNSNYIETIVPVKPEQIFLDEYIFAKTDIGKYELIIILKPKRLRKISFAGSSDLYIAQNHSNELFSIIKHYLAKEENVEKILFLKKDDIFHIWTVISGYNDEENRKKIYKREIELMSFFSRADFHFDFYLIDFDEIDEVLSLGAIIIYER